MAWNLDTSHSEVTFVARHMMFSKVRGQFTDWSGTADVDGQGRLTNVDVTVQIASIDTRDEKRDGHLRSADFFDADQHPTMRFVGSASSGSGASFSLTGDLTIRGTTKPVTFEAEALGEGKDPWGNTRRGYAVRGKVNRFDYGLNWNAALEAGGVLVGPEIDIEVQVQVVGG